MVISSTARPAGQEAVEVMTVPAVLAAGAAQWSTARQRALMDGIEATRRLALLGVTVILVTGTDSAARVSEGIDAGAAAWVRKSDGIGVLATLLRAATHIRGH